MRISLFCAAILWASSAAAAESPTTSESGLRIGKGAESATICVVSDSALTRLTAQRLADFISNRTGLQPKVVPGPPAGSESGIVFLLTRESEPSIRGVTSQPTAMLPDMKAYRDDGYTIRTPPRGDVTCVICAGKGDSGIKYAVYRLMRATTTRDRILTVPLLHLEANPFFRGRYATPSSVMAASAPPLLQKHYAWENWDVSRVATLSDFFDAAGMNGLFLFDSPCRYNWTGNHTPPEQMAIKIRTIAKRAQDLNMSVCLWVHGASDLASGRFSDLQPRDPEQRKQILADFDRLAERYGDVIDALYGHWVDPGGAPPPADITDPQKLQMEIFNRLERKAGRKLVNIFSAHGLNWPMGPGGTLPWAGYTGPDSLTGSGILPKGTSIASPEMRIYPGEIEFARKVRAAGYTCGIFGWLVAEYEMNPGIHVHTHIMDSYFHQIPDEARDLFDWYEEGLVYTTLNLPTFYVFSQMLWDPKSSADQHLADFCQAAFGPELGPRMLKGYRAIADVRCGDAGPEDRGGCRLGRGSADPARDLKICEAAVAELDGAYADYSYLPTIPLTVSIEAMINDLRAQLGGMATYARFRSESGKVARFIASGGTDRQIRDAIATLPKMEVWPGSSQPKTPGTWGQPEYQPYIDVVNRWEQQLQAAAAGGPPEVKGATLFSDDFSRYPEGADGRPAWQPTTDAPEGGVRPQWATQQATMSVNIPAAGGALGSATGLLLAGKPEWGNYSVQLRIKWIREAQTGGSVGLRVRVIGGDPPQTQSGYVVRMSRGQVEFGWLSGGAFKPLQVVPVSSAPDAWHTLRVDSQSYLYKVYLDGKLLLGADDWYGPRKGRVALEVRNAQAAFDEVVVKQIE